MKGRGSLSPHIIAVMALVGFIVLGLASASAPESAQKSNEVVYTEISITEFMRGYYNDDFPSGKGFIIDAYIKSTPGAGENSFEFVSNPSDKEALRISDHINTSHWGSRDYESYVFSHQVERYDPYLRFDKDKLYRIYICVYAGYRDGRIVAFVDKIEGLIEDDRIISAREEEEREVAQEAQRQARERAGKVEQERLANLYRQAGNNFGNLRNTTKIYGRALIDDYLTSTINFGDGKYIEQDKTVLGLSFSPETGTYRVNGDMVIFLSSEGEYKSGTIIGTALNIGGRIYR